MKVSDVRPPAIAFNIGVHLCVIDSFFFISNDSLLYPSAFTWLFCGSPLNHNWVRTHASSESRAKVAGWARLLRRSVSGAKLVGVWLLLPSGIVIKFR